MFSVIKYITFVPRCNPLFTLFAVELEMTSTGGCRGSRFNVIEKVRTCPLQVAHFYTFSEGHTSCKVMDVAKAMSQAELSVDLRKLLVLLPMWISFVMGTIFGAALKHIADRSHSRSDFYLRCFCRTCFRQARDVHSGLYDDISWTGIHDVKALRLCFAFKILVAVPKWSLFQAGFERLVPEVWPAVLAGEIAGSLTPGQSIVGSAIVSFFVLRCIPSLSAPVPGEFFESAEVSRNQQ